MRCAECVTDPLTPGHYCECCGRKLSIQERKALETATAAVTCHHDAPAQSDPPVSRCESCCGPSTNGALCASCETAFGPILGRDTTAAPTLIDLVPAGEKAPAAPLAPVMVLQLTPEVAPAVPQVAQYVVPEVSAEEGLSAEELEAQAAQAAKAAEAKAEAARKTAASVIADRAAAAEKREKDMLARGPRPVAAMSSAPPATAPSRSRNLLLTVAAFAILGIVGFTQKDLLLRTFKPAHATLDAQSGAPALLADATISTAGVPRATSPRARAAAQTAAAPPAVARPRVTHPPVEAASKPVSAVKPSKPSAAVKPVAHVAVPAASTPAPVAPVKSAPATPAPAAAAARPRTTQRAAATGKFFEPNDVDVSPKVARRIEPQIPADLKDRSINDIVIVRVLVSQDGDASRVSLLRKSRHGKSMDEAVLAAVTQWSFLPAKKKGAAVSSWYNVGVPLGQNN